MKRAIENTPLTVFLLLLGVLILPPAAHAGIADSPLPVLVAGQTTLFVYSVPGVRHGGGLATFFSCTSLEPSATIQVGVEVFGGPGGAPVNDAAATSLSLAPGATQTFGTGLAVGISAGSDLGAPVSQGSARILATSKKLACTAFIADVGNAPPTSMVQLTIISKLKQKAAN